MKQLFSLLTHLQCKVPAVYLKLSSSCSSLLEMNHECFFWSEADAWIPRCTGVWRHFLPENQRRKNSSLVRHTESIINDFSSQEPSKWPFPHSWNNALHALRADTMILMTRQSPWRTWRAQPELQKAHQGSWAQLLENKSSTSVLTSCHSSSTILVWTIICTHASSRRHPASIHTSGKHLHLE